MGDDITISRSQIAGDSHDSHNEDLESGSDQYLEFSLFIRFRIELDPTTADSYLAMLCADCSSEGCCALIVCCPTAPSCVHSRRLAETM